MLLRDCDELHECGGDSGRVQPIDSVHGLERAGYGFKIYFGIRLQFHLAHACGGDRISWNDRQYASVSTARPIERKPRNDVSSAARVAGWQPFSRQPAFMDSAPVYRFPDAASGIFPKGGGAREFF